MFSLIGALIIGLIVGAIAKLLMPGKDPGGIWITMALGVAGSLIATYLGRALGLYANWPVRRLHNVRLRRNAATPALSHVHPSPPSKSLIKPGSFFRRRGLQPPRSTHYKIGFSR
jgi:uncharacterized membrane protein YeaQ/YmgE (transglycosylase-associated protein family)